MLFLLISTCYLPPKQVWHINTMSWNITRLATGNFYVVKIGLTVESSTSECTAYTLVHMKPVTGRSATYTPTTYWIFPQKTKAYGCCELNSSDLIEPWDLGPMAGRGMYGVHTYLRTPAETLCAVAQLLVQKSVWAHLRHPSVEQVCLRCLDSHFQVPAKPRCPPKRPLGPGAQTGRSSNTNHLPCPQETKEVHACCRPQHGSVPPLWPCSPDTLELPQESLCRP